MKATELRIGNWVSETYYLRDPGGEHKYFKDTRIENGKDIDKSELYEPIPLTEEWLLKFGFEKENKTWGKDYFLIDSDDLTINFENAWGEDRIVKLQHVHKLQNLYFTITGEELLAS